MTHTFHTGDAADILQDLKRDSIDLIVTVPTFGDIRMSKGWTLDLHTIGIELARVLKPGRVCVLLTQDVMVNKAKSLKSFRTVIDWCDHTSLALWSDFIVLRNANVSPIYWKTRPRITHEYAFVFVNRKGGEETPLVYHNEHRLKSGMDMGSILDYSAGTIKNDRRLPKDKKDILNTPTPFQFAKDMILMFSDQYETVLDCFCGIGTTNVVAEETKRSSVGIDILQDAIDMAIEEITKTQQGLL